MLAEGELAVEHGDHAAQPCPAFGEQLVGGHERVLAAQPFDGDPQAVQSRVVYRRRPKSGQDLRGISGVSCPGRLVIHCRAFPLSSGLLSFRRLGDARKGCARCGGSGLRESLLASGVPGQGHRTAFRSMILKPESTGTTSATAERIFAATFDAPPVGFEPTHTAPEAVALSPELWGRATRCSARTLRRDRSKGTSLKPSR